MLSVERILLDGALLTLVMSVMIVLSLLVNPRIWLHDYPAAIRELAPPLSAGEKRQQRVFMIPFLLGFVLVPFLSTRAFVMGAGDGVTFLGTFLHAFALFNIFNLFDALVIDWLWLGLLHPRFALIPEAWGRRDLLLDYRKLVTDWLKGIGFCAVGGLLVAGVTLLVV